MDASGSNTHLVPSPASFFHYPVYSAGPAKISVMKLTDEGLTLRKMIDLLSNNQFLLANIMLDKMFANTNQPDEPPLLDHNHLTNMVLHHNQK